MDVIPTEWLFRDCSCGHPHCNTQRDQWSANIAGEVCSGPCAPHPYASTLLSSASQALSENV